MQELGVPLSRSEMKSITGGVAACFECTSDQNQTLDTFYCSTTQDCINQTMNACQGQTHCECHAA